jgi:hypothetical protein
LLPFDNPMFRKIGIDNLSCLPQKATISTHSMLHARYFRISRLRFPYFGQL